MSWQRKQKMPKPRIPVAKPGIRHKSAKDYVRQKKVDTHDAEEEIRDYFWDREYDADCHDEDMAVIDLIFLLDRLGISSASSRNRRMASYG